MRRPDGIMRTEGCAPDPGKEEPAQAHSLWAQFGLILFLATVIVLRYLATGQWFHPPV